VGPSRLLDTSWPLNRSRSGNATTSCVVDSILEFRGWSNLKTGPEVPPVQSASQDVRLSQAGIRDGSPAASVRAFGRVDADHWSGVLKLAEIV
jgi:hypothetical protein